MYRENTVFIYDMIYDTIIYDITSHIIHLKNIVNMNFKATMIQSGYLWKQFDIQRIVSKETLLLLIHPFSMLKSLQH